MNKKAKYLFILNSSKCMIFIIKIFIVIKIVKKKKKKKKKNIMSLCVIIFNTFNFNTIFIC